jgi:fatty acid desaturase
VRRNDRLLLLAFAALIAAALAAVFVLALLGGPGWVMFVVVIVLFATIWVGAFWLVVPSDRHEGQDIE